MRCAVGCGFRYRGDDNGHGLDDVRGDANHPVSAGKACQRGIEETLASDGSRITRPLIRDDGVLVPTTWDTALDAVVERFRTALDTQPDAAAVLGSGQQTNEAAYALGKLARGGFGTRYYDANTTLCMASAVTAYYQAFGSDAPPPTYDDIPEAKTHLVWGANPSVAHPVLYRWIVDSAAEADSQLIVVDPVATETAADADYHVQLEPGTDLAFARGVLSQLIEADALDESFIAEATVGFEDLRTTLPSVEDAASTAGVSVETVESVATAVREPTLAYWGMGVNQSVQGTGTARALIDLCLATGNLRPGSGPFSLTGQANSMGTRLCSSKGTWPSHRPFGAPEHRDAVAETWNIPVTRLPDDPGPGPVGIVDALAEGTPEICWTVATNPVVGMPDADRVKEILSETFLVVQDAFMTETAELADVVLPAATWGESEGTVINMERTVSRVRPATDPLPSVRQDIDIITAIGHRLDSDLFERPATEPESIYEELRKLTAGTPADIAGITYERLDSDLAVRWPAPHSGSQGGYRYHTEDGWTFPTESGCARFSTARHGGLAEPTDEQFPLTLTTGRRPDAYNTAVRSRSTDTDGPPVARIHPETVMAHSEAIDRQRTVVASRRSSIRVSIQADETVPEGVVWLPIHHPRVNELTISLVDPESSEPNFKQCAVTLRRPADR